MVLPNKVENPEVILTGYLSNSCVPKHDIARLAKLRIIRGVGEFKFEDCSEVATMRNVFDGEHTNIFIEISHKHDVFGEFFPLAGDRKITVIDGKRIVLEKLIQFPDVHRASYEPHNFQRNGEEYKNQINWVSLSVDPSDYRTRIAYPKEDFRVSPGSYIYISFNYIVSIGTTDSFIKLKQLQDAPNLRFLDSKDFHFKVDGKFHKFEKVIHIEDANRISLEFRIGSDSDMGDLIVNEIIIKEMNDGADVHH